MLHLQILGPWGIKISYTIRAYNAVLKRSTKCVMNVCVCTCVRACLHIMTIFDFIIGRYQSPWQLSDNCNSVLKIWMNISCSSCKFERIHDMKEQVILTWFQQRVPSTAGRKPCTNCQSIPTYVFHIDYYVCPYSMNSRKCFVKCENRAHWISFCRSFPF